MNGETVSYWWITNQNGNITIQDLFRIDCDYGLKFTWSGSGTVSFYSGMGEWGKPYYIKIDGTVYQESSHWSWDEANDAVVITADLSSHMVEVYWAPLPAPGGSGSVGGGGAPSSPITKISESAQKFVQTVVKPALFKIPEYYVGLLILGFMFVSLAIAWRSDLENTSIIIGLIITVYVLNLLAIWVLLPQRLFPEDLNFLKNYLWRPPALNFQVVGMPTSQVQILQMLTIISLFGIFAGSIILFARRD